MRKKLILKVASEKFSEKGYYASLTEIAKGSGISKQTLYNYYENKEDLFFDVINMEMETYFDAKRIEFDSYSSLNAETRLKNMFFSIITYFMNRDKLRFWRWIILIDSAELKKRCINIIEDREHNFLAILNETFMLGMRNGEIKVQPIQPLTNTYIALIHGLLDGASIYEKALKSNPFPKIVWMVFWQGISAKIKEE